MKDKTAKPLLGHKCKGAQVGASVSCECGWKSSTWYGKGARANAYAEFWWHVDQHRRQTVQGTTHGA